MPITPAGLSGSAEAPAFPSRPDASVAMGRSGGDGRSGATRSHAQRVLSREHEEGWAAKRTNEHRTFPCAARRGTLRTSRRIRRLPLGSTYKRYVTESGP